MFKFVPNKAQATVRNTGGQAATELAVFGAVLIFLIGSIVRAAVSNSYQQDQNFKAMRMAMLESWKFSKANPGLGTPQNTSRNSAQILFIQDRLSPDYNKYGDLDRSPAIASGSGSFSYNLLYPISDADDILASLPVMDTYINGQYFPFTMASYVALQAIEPPANCPYAAGSCLQNQCLRNQREWSGGIVKETTFVSANLAPITLYGECADGSSVCTTSNSCPTGISCNLTEATSVDSRTAQMQNNACTIFTDLARAQVFTSKTITGNLCDPNVLGTVNPAVKTPVETSPQWANFVGLYEASFPNNTAVQNKQYLAAILKIVNNDHKGYKLFYTLVPNPGTGWSTSPGICASHPCMNGELSADVPLLGYNGQPTTDGVNSTNVNGVMQYDLLRNAYYSSAPSYACSSPPCPSVMQQFPTTGCPNCLRSYIAWRWAATAGTTAAMIGLNTSNNQYPTYDIDGRLKEVTIYSIIQDEAGTTFVSYEDSEGGDIDESWDANSCGPKPGLQPNSLIYTFTKDGTYLRISEGKLYDPESNTFVRSMDKRDSVDLVQRDIQLSNNTGRFCTNPAKTNQHSVRCPSYCQADNTVPALGGKLYCSDCAIPDSVEICVDESFATDNCFTPTTIAQTCYDTNLNRLFVRSRIQDLRGGFWLTNTLGQMKVQQ